MDGAVHAAPTRERAVGRVDDRVGGELGYVILREADA